jgi:hypothetical protein
MSNFVQCGVCCLAQIIFSTWEGLVHTKDILAAALRDAGLPEIAGRAADGYYHDYLSPLATPEKQLLSELTIIGTPAALMLCEQVKRGDFDPSDDESDAWASSPAGQAAIQAFAVKFNKRRA